MRPDLVAHWINSAYAANAQGRYEDAVRQCFQALQLAPSIAAAWYNLGVAQRGLRKIDEAIGAQRRAAGLATDSADGQTSIGLELLELRAYQDAETCLNLAVRLRPDHAAAYLNLGLLRQRQGRIGDAESLFRKAAEIDPDLPHAHSNLCAALNKLNQPEAAQESCRKAIRLNPSLAEAWNNLGVSLRYLKRHVEAVEASDRAVHLDPSSIDALYNLGVVLTEVGEKRRAIETLYRALTIRPEFLPARWALAMAALPRVQTDGESIEDSRAAFLDGLIAVDSRLNDNIPPDEAAEIVGSLQPFALAYQARNNRDILATYGGICAKVMGRWLLSTKIKPPKPSKGSRIRISIVSSHFRRHSVWDALIKGWLVHLDRSKFRVSCFSVGSASDHETQIAKERSDTFIENQRSLSDWVRAIFQESNDVLVYPEIGMDKLTTQLAAMRLAPVQVAAWGHPETTGLPTMDYFLSAEDLEPENASANYAEKLVMLPNLGCSLDRYDVQPTDVELDQYGISPERPILISPGSTLKYCVEYDAVLVELAKAIPSGQILLFASNANPGPSRLLHDRIRRAFDAAALDSAAHIRILPWLDRASFFGLLAKATVYLDTMGFSGFNTAMQAIESGLPVVSKEGRFMRGRLACGILKRLDLQDLIARSDEEYVSLVARIVADDLYRSHIRQKMLQRYPLLLNDAAPIEGLQQFLLNACGRS